MSQPKFKEGDLVRVKNPERYLSALAKKIADRDAVVVRNLFNPGDKVGEKYFCGHVIVEFQRRNGRGKVFTERFYERDLVLASTIKPDGV